MADVNLVEETTKGNEIKAGYDLDDTSNHVKAKIRAFRDIFTPTHQADNQEMITFSGAGAWGVSLFLDEIGDFIDEAVNFALSTERKLNAIEENRKETTPPSTSKDVLSKVGDQAYYLEMTIAVLKIFEGRYFPDETRKKDDVIYSDELETMELVINKTVTELLNIHSELKSINN